MGGIGFLLAINIALSLGFAAKFAAIAWFDRRRPGPRWLAVGFGLGTVYALAEVLISTGVAPFVGHMLAGVGYTLALAAVTIGLGHHYDNRADPRLVGALVAVSVPLYAALYFLPRDDLTRQIVYQAPYFVLQVLAIVLVVTSPRRRGVLDGLLIGGLVLNALNSALRPAIAAVAGGVGARPEDYANSLYGMISQSSGAILVLLVAVLSFLVLARDIALYLMARSEFDEETGFYTPRGFETRIGVALEGRAGPQALMLVGVTACGPNEDVSPDRMRAVTDALKTLTPPWAVRAQLGASVYAVFDPAANVLAARRAMRAFVASATGPDIRLFVGVAETEAGDVPAVVMTRAEVALAQARLAGENSVRIAPRSNLAIPDRLTG